MPDKRNAPIVSNFGDSDARRKKSGFVKRGRKYVSFCPNGAPHRRITGDEFISRVYPDIWSKLLELGGPAPLGWEWQYCVNCGHAMQTETDPDLTSRAIVYTGEPADGIMDGQTDARRPHPPDGPETRGSYSEPGWVSTTIAGSRLHATRATIRNWIADGILTARRIQNKGVSIWIVSEASIAAKLGNAETVSKG